MKNLVITLIVFFTCSLHTLWATPNNFTGKTLLVGKNSELFVDSTGSMTYDEVKTQENFVPIRQETSNFGLTNYTYWFRFTITNQTNEDELILELHNSMLDTAEFFDISKSIDDKQAVYFKDKFYERNINYQNPAFKFRLAKGATRTYYVRINGNELLIVPLVLRTATGFWQSATTNEIISGLLFGLLIAMILYNLFIYLTIWDKSYLYYVLYILFICLTQATITGYTFKFLWPNQPYFANQAIIFFTAHGGIFAILFLRTFLHTHIHARTIHYLLHGIIVIYLLAIVVRILGNDRISYRLIDIAALFGTLLVLIVAIKLSLKGQRTAKFFLLAWSSFLVGIILFVLRNLNILPYGIFSNNTMQAGTAIEVVLLSFALADKIKILQKEEAASREKAIFALKENERMVREQNILLEEKVNERTIELTNSNTELNHTLNKLKDAQAQLIESEKLASLGQLTAGIAHEINNPINFVSANIRPLKRDIEDLLHVLSQYESIDQATTLESIQSSLKAINILKDDLDIDYIKEELDLLLIGIEEGAHRTVDIVKGLKNFSRLDETDINTVNVNEGIQSTLILLNNQIGDRINVVSNLGKLPDIECYPGKLNQVFMNIISNAIFAVTEKPINGGSKPSIWITTTRQDDRHIKIAIKDNGTGMTPEIKSKIFDPFFTTKDVGKGTGLGLSIVFKIIEAHNGTIDVYTEPQNGTEFVITLPLSNN